MNDPKLDQDQIHAGRPDPPKADFSDLLGCWEDDPGFDEIIASQRKVDLAKW